jgi:hypothetical protein
MADCFERYCAPSGSIEGGEFLDHLRSELLKEIAAPWMDRHYGWLPVSLTGSVAEPSCYVNVLLSCVGCALGVRPYRAHCKWRSPLR